MRKSVVVILASVVFIVVLIASGIWYLKPSLLEPITSQFMTSRPNVIIESIDPTIQLTPSNNFPKSTEFYAHIENINDPEKTIKITITSDEKAAALPFIKKGKTVSGFSFPDKQNVYNILIYMSPEILANQGDYQFEITRNYVLALLYASEYEKYNKNLAYSPDYKSVQTLMDEITMNSVEAKKFPVLITTK